MKLACNQSIYLPAGDNCKVHWSLDLGHSGKLVGLILVTYNPTEHFHLLARDCDLRLSTALKSALSALNK